jgi:hypothetical protein
MRLASPSLSAPVERTLLPFRIKLGLYHNECPWITICSADILGDTSNAPRRTRPRKFTRETAAGAEAGTPASAWDADATLKSCNKTVFLYLQPSEEAGP